MKVNYWILKLGIWRLLKIITGKKHSDEVTVGYINASGTASLLLKLLKKIKNLTIAFNKIQSRFGTAGPILNISTVRNDKGEVIIMDIYHHVLSIRRQISAQLLEIFKGTCLFQGKRPISMLIAYLGMKIAEEITPAVFMANRAKWKSDNERDIEKIKNILVIQKSEWSHILAEHFKHMADQVHVERNAHASFISILKAGRSIISAVINSGVGQSIKILCGKNKIEHEGTPYDFRNGKIMVTYGMGLQEDQRNDISFYFASGMKPSRLLIYFKSHLPWISESEIQWLKANKISHFSKPGLANPVPGVEEWQSSPRMKEELKKFSLAYLETLSQCFKTKRKYSLWMLVQLWEMGKKVAWWKDFFIFNRVNIVVHSVPSNENFIPHMAISEIGGIAASIERSILFDYCTYIHNPPNHLHFVTGSYSLSQIPEPSFSLFTVQVGGINVDGNPALISGIEKLKSNSDILIAVFDELPNDVFFGDSIRQMYQTLIDLVKEDDRFGLLIKSKKPQVLMRLPDIAEKVKALSEKGKCVIANWQVSASDAASHSDMVIGVPSTAVFESVLTGTRTIVYNPMRSGSTLFYSNNGLGRRIFENPGSMHTALKRFADKQDDSVGDCTDIAGKIDPFSDNQGAKRLGTYLHRCLEGLNANMGWEKTIREANASYVEEWGHDKITNENAYEKDG